MTEPESPTVGTSGRTSAKRPRQALNCKPCRNSKLKCDRKRPCSSCILRGHAAFCYQNEGPSSAHDNKSKPHRIVNSKFEFKRIQQSLASLQAHVLRLEASWTPAPDHSSIRDGTQEQKSSSPDVSNSLSPGMTGHLTHRGFYTGPTTSISYLDSISSLSDEGDGNISNVHEDILPTKIPLDYEADIDLISQLPTLSIIDSLVDYYFEFCTWILSVVHQPSFLEAWAEYKSGKSANRVVLATVCAIMAETLCDLPESHPMIDRLTESRESLRIRYHNIMRSALHRYQLETNAYSMELVELLLIRSQVLMRSNIHNEEIWRVSREFVAVGTAMGLHREPGTGMPIDVAERRRWAWWHIIGMERWQAFTFGRPPSIASHHFDTRYPSVCDPSVDSTGRLFVPNFALFRLAHLLGDIIDDMLSLRPVPYSKVIAHDKNLQEWLDSLPPELNLDDDALAHSLCSPVTAVCRFGAQSVYIRSIFHHIRFAMHEPYVIAAHQSPDMTRNWDIAIDAAESLISLALQGRPEFLDNASPAVAGYMIFGPIHIFSAAMFFTRLLSDKPDMSESARLRRNIHKAISTLERLDHLPMSRKAFVILKELGPLYSEEYGRECMESRLQTKAKVLSKVKNLGFPYDSSSYTRPVGTDMVTSPTAQTCDTPLSIGSDSPHVSSLLGQSSMTMPSSFSLLSDKSSSADQFSSEATFLDIAMSMASDVVSESSSILGMHIAQSACSPSGESSSSSPVTHMSAWLHSQPSITSFGDLGDGVEAGLSMRSMDERSVWGASIGFAHGELAEFLDEIQRNMPAN